MKNKYIIESIITAFLIFFLLICLNPLEIFMPSPIINLILIIMLIIFGIFASIIWREKSGDERETLHKFFAGHLAFLTGSTLLITAITLQEIKDELDPWLVYILIVMILTKIVGRIYSQKKL